MWNWSWPGPLHLLLHALKLTAQSTVRRWRSAAPRRTIMCADTTVVFAYSSARTSAREEPAVRCHGRRVRESSSFKSTLERYMRGLSQGYLGAAIRSTINRPQKATVQGTGHWSMPREWEPSQRLWNHLCFQIPTVQDQCMCQLMPEQFGNAKQR